MADLSSLLAVLEHDPDDGRALDALAAAARAAPADLRSSRFAAARKVLSQRGRPDTVVQLLEIELATTAEVDRQVDLLLEKGMALDSELLDAAAARAAFHEALRLRPKDTLAPEALGELDVGEQNWKKFAAKYVKEAAASTDRSLATALYGSAAEQYVKFAPEEPDAEGFLRKALDVDAKNGKAAFHLARLLRRAKRWQDLGELYDARAEQAATNEEKVSALIALSELAKEHLGNAARADRAIKRALALDPAHPRALSAVTDAAAAASDWPGVVAAYQAALKARRDGDDLGMLLQIGMVLWKHMNDLDGAEEYFKRIRKLDSGHPAALDFYRAYYTAKGESGKLMALLKQVEKGAPRPRSDTGEKSISIEIAELAEAQNNPEKAIEAWKQHLRAEPASAQARAALARLYRRTEKWNALLDLMKDEVERLAETEVAARVGKLFEVVEIYRDRLRLDVMVINTYGAILKLDPDNARATDELAAKYRALGRWNDLITVLTRKADAANVTDGERIGLLREIADLWAERFGNFANAIRPLERIVELEPGDSDAALRLKDIYTKRRQWRALIDLLGREATVLPPAERRAKRAEMGRLAAERLGDTRLAIEIYTGGLAEAPDVGDADALVALAGLYEREKRWLALAEILQRQAAALGTKKEAIALFERLGQVYADRLGAPKQAAEVWKSVLAIEPAHAKALRTLRELYATAGDFAGLEALYARLGQEDELVEALLAIADRLDAKSARLPLVERAAQLAQQRAEVKDAPANALEKARQVWERVLAVEPQHVGAARALAPIYSKQEKWARLLSVLEIELTAAQDQAERLEKIAAIRQLCEQKLASRNLAFQWTVRAFDLEPTNAPLYADVLRLASDPEHWREIVSSFERALAKKPTPELELKLTRELAKVAGRRLGDPERARGYHRRVLELAPDDREAEGQLEELATHVADWNELLASYRRRVQREKEPAARAQLLVETAVLQEEKLVDLDGAAATYKEALAAAPSNVRAMRALARIEEARGDWDSLATVLASELALATDQVAKFELLMRLGNIEEHNLERPGKALPHFTAALALGTGNRPKAIAALVRYLEPDGPGRAIDSKQRVAAARLLLPFLDKGRDHALALEIIRAADDTPASERLDLDRTLMRLYHIDLGDPAAAWLAGLRVLAADPADSDMRGALGLLAGQLGRDGEWARHLATALAALRAKNGPPPEVRSIATELAKLAGDRLGDRVAAEKAWITVLEVEPDAPDAFEALGAMYRADARWTDLRALLERRADVTIDDAVRLTALLQLAKLEEEVLGDPVRATAAYKRVLELDSDNDAAYAALDQLYTQGASWAELEQLLAQHADQIADQKADAPRQLGLLYRRAELFAHRLSNASRAVDLLEDVVNRAKHHEDARELLEELLKTDAVGLRVARLLEPLYEGDKLWKDLAAILRMQRGKATGTEAVELLSRIATIEETELAGARNAFDAWVEVLGLDPTHERARIELARLAQWLNRWPEAMAALETAATATPASDVVTRAALLGELAAYYDLQLGDADRAIATYKRLLEVDPSSSVNMRRAGAALARLYEERGNWAELRGVTRMQSEWAEEPAERRALLARVAALEEDKLGDRGAAITTWRDVLGDAPNDAGALHALERLYQAGEKWRELVDILQRKLDTAGTAGEAVELLGRIAHIHEYRLHEADEAIAAWLDVVDRAPDDPHALSELARLYRSVGRNADLLDVLERQANAATGGAKLALQVEIARLLSGPLARPIDALDRWALVLDSSTDAGATETALAAVEAALDDVDLRLMAADILRPVYARGHHDERLAKLHERTAEWSDDPTTKLRALGEVVRLREERLGDKAGAFAAQLVALRHAATEPELAQVVAETERLAGELGREGDLIDAYRDVAPNVLDAEIQRRLYLDVADLARAVRRDLPLAREFYQKVLDAQPDDRRALAALESIYRETNDDDRLVEILLRQAEAPGVGIDEKVGGLVEAAGMYAQLKRSEDAMNVWEQVLAIAPERGDAAYALETLYSQAGRWHDVIDLYERRLGFATSIDEAVALQVQLGELHDKQLHDVESAIENYAAALGGNAKQPVALAALERYLNDPDARSKAAEVLEPIYVAQSRWQDLIRVFEAKLASAAEPRERLRLTRFVARLYEEQLEDFENASRWYAKVFREAPDDDAIRDQLQRLASMVDNWAFVAQTYQGYLDDETGESLDVRDVAIAAASIYDRRLGDADRAYLAYRRALAIDVDDAVPDTRELVRRIEDMLGRAQKWPELIAVYDDVIARGDDDLRRETLIKRARLYEDGMADQVHAIETWREVVIATDAGGTPAADHAYREAVGELERLFRARSQWHDLVDLLEARLGRVQDAFETAELRLRLAEVLEVQLSDLPSAIDQYEEVIHGGARWDKAVQALERLVVHDEHRERIAELLEPVYRDQDWWQKLVVILDAKLQYIQDPADQVLTLHEIAELHEERGGAIELALSALARAWRIDVADDAALTKLLSLAGKLEAWDDVVRTVEGGAATAPNSDMAAGLWARAAEIHEAQRGDVTKAIEAWRKVDEARSDDLVALAALDRLLALAGNVHELVVVIARRADLTDDAGVRLVLLHRVAALYEEVLLDRAAAIAAYRNVLGVDDTDLAALDALERLYAAPGDTHDPRELAATLERKIELTTDLPARQALRIAAAKVYEHDLKDIYQAIGQLTAVLDDDQGDATALAELDRIYGAERMWPELLDVVDRRALLAISARDRADLAYRSARIVEHELADPDAAIPRYGAVLQISATHESSRASLEGLMAPGRGDDHVEPVTQILERVYRSEREAAGLIRVYERRLAAAGRDPAARRSDWAELAEVRETLANQPTQAFLVWERALADDPDDTELLKPLARLAESQSLWKELASALEDLLGKQSLPPDVDELYSSRLGQIAEERLGDLDRAARAYERASNGPEPRPALVALERVLARNNKWQELAGVLRRQAEAADQEIQAAEYLFRLGDLQETTLRDAAAAVAAYREVLATAPAHHGARVALERMLQTDTDQRREIVEILEPLYEQDGDAARLVTVLEARLSVTDDILDRASLLGRIVELTEGKLGDRGRALDAALRWLAIDPASHQAIGEIERLADRLGQWRETAERLGAIVHSVDATSREPEVQVGLLVFLASVLRGRLGQAADAIGALRDALVLEPASLAALDPLIDILRQQGDHAALADALRQRGRVVSDVVEQRAAFAEVAKLSERSGDRAGAIDAWRQVIEQDDTDREALAELARILRGVPADRDQLIDVLGRAARAAGQPDDEKALRVEIAQLEAGGPRAVGAWQAVVDLDPDDLAALGSLEEAHARAGEWHAVGEIQGRRLSLAKTAQERVAIHAEMAKLSETRRGSVDDAIAAWFEALDVDSAYAPAYVELERLLAAGSRWHDLVELLERLAELRAAQADSPGEIAALARAADVWEAKLDNPDAAGEILEKILAREPGSVAALTRLSKIYERAGDWDKCKATLEQALKLGPTGRDAADLFFRIGEVARLGDHDDDTAVQHFQQALRHDPAHAEAIAALEKLARERRDDALLADMLARRVQTVATAAERVDLLVEVAELERRAGRTDAALAALGRASQEAPTDVRVLGPLADLYFAAGRLDEAAPIYDRLAEEAKTARRMKDVARFRQRQGGIFEARGDRPRALTAYEEALRVNPTDVVTMTGLGRLYFSAGDWEKARKIYQSLVLQNIEPDIGVTKGEVYWALGKIHIELGQSPKAKSMFQRGLEIEPANQKLREALSSLQ